MSDDWKPGDLAILIRTQKRKGGALYADGQPPMRKGGIYRVESVLWCGGECGLVIEGHYSIRAHRAWAASSFKRVPPHTPDAEDAEVIALLNGAGVKEASDA